MARVTITPTSVPASDPATVGNSLSVLAFTAADTTDKNAFAPTGRDFLLIWNSGASQRTATVEGVDEADDIDVTIEAGEVGYVDTLPLNDYRQADGKVWCEASHAEVKFAVIRF